MELGNAIFSNSRGEFKVPETFEPSMSFLFDDLGIGDHEGYENDTFVIRPYYWGDCTCGFEEMLADFENNNDHRDYCYRKLVEKDLIEQYGWTKDSIGILEPTESISINEKMRIKEKVQKKWCKRLGLSTGIGMAIHCTCDYKERRNKFLSEHDHDEWCPIVLPNFYHKPTGFSMQWYKRPLRNSYMNMDLTKDQFKDIIKDCIKSAEDQSNT